MENRGNGNEKVETVVEKGRKQGERLVNQAADQLQQATERAESLRGTVSDAFRRSSDGAIFAVADRLDKVGQRLLSTAERTGFFPDAARAVGQRVQRGAETMRTKGSEGLCEDLRAAIRSRPLTAVAIAMAIPVFSPRLLRR